MSIAYVAAFAIFMAWSSQDQPGTDFTALQCTESLSNIAVIGVIATVAQRLGYPMTLMLGALAAVFSWILLATWLLPRHTPFAASEGPAS